MPIRSTRNHVSWRAVFDAGSAIYLFGVEVLVISGHVLGHGVEIHLLADGCLDDLFERVLCMSTELAGMGMVRERHGDWLGGRTV